MPNQDLVPTGLPYGDRRKLVSQAQEVGVPTSSDAGGVGNASPLSIAPPAPAPSPAGPALPRTDFDVLASRQPTRPQIEEADPVALMIQRLAASPNPFYQELGRKLVEQGQ